MSDQNNDNPADADAFLKNLRSLFGEIEAADPEVAASRIGTTAEEVIDLATVCATLSSANLDILPKSTRELLGKVYKDPALQRIFEEEYITTRALILSLGEDFFAPSDDVSDKAPNITPRGAAGEIGSDLNKRAGKPKKRPGPGHDLN